MEQSSNFIIIQAPSYRSDIEIEEDLIEEISRINGYNHLKQKALIQKLFFPNLMKILFIFKIKLEIHLLIETLMKHLT